MPRRQFRERRDVRVMMATVIAVFAACKAGEKDVQPSARSAEAQVAAWDAIVALSLPVGVTPSTPVAEEELERALGIAHEHAIEWRALRAQRPQPPLSEYPEGSAALRALEKWAKTDGGLPRTNFAEVGFFAMSARDLGALAIETSSPERATAGLGIELGIAFVQQGRNLLELQLGLALLAIGKDRGQRIVIDVDFVRVLAAEALFVRRSAAFFATAEGKRALEDAYAKLTDLDSGQEIKLETPDRGTTVALEAFWIAALDGARRGEPVELTVARLRKAVSASSATVASKVRIVPQLVETMRQQVQAFGVSDQ
jgi:hypothetical protein